MNDSWAKRNPTKQRTRVERWKAENPEKWRSLKDRINGRLRARYAADPAYRAAHLAKNRKWNRATSRARHLREKVRALELIGGARCVRCGCDDVRALEVNHKERTWTGKRPLADVGTYLRFSILSGRVDRRKFNVLCRPCNNLDYLERRFPDLKGKLHVVWSPNTEDN